MMNCSCESFVEDEERRDQVLIICRVVESRKISLDEWEERIERVEEMKDEVECRSTSRDSQRVEVRESYKEEG